jgi:hypothetical protein
MSLPLSRSGSLLWRVVALVASVALLVGALAPAVTAKSSGIGTQKLQRIEKVGKTRISGAPARVSEPDTLQGEVRPDPEERAEEGEREKFVRNPISTARVPSSHVPRPAVQDVIDATGTHHFDGLNHFDQRFAGTGDYANTQFSLEPPDQGLCVGNGFVVETVNTVVRVRTTAGSTLTAAIPLNDFFNLAPEIIRSDPLVFGDFTSDPKCYFDVDTDRWFLTLLQLGVEPDTGNFTGDSSLLIAVSTSGDPTGSWNLFSIDTTNDGTEGTPSHPGCPCFGDQPLIGADANGFYVTTNEFPVFEPGFNGAIVYAMSKTLLAAGSIGTVVQIHQPTLAEGQAYSLQPATTPPGAAYATEHNGTEYFLSALEFTGGLDNRIALWSLTNTASLSAATPSVAMQVAVLDSEVYGAPPTMIQRDGPTPLRSLIKSKLAPVVLGVKSASEHLNLLNSNDDRMNQTVYVNGQIWGALNTVVKGPTGPTRTGIAWFAVMPTLGATLGGSVTAQGYVAVRNNNVSFPAVAANPAGDVLVAYSLVGPDFYPSAAYSWLSASGGTGDVNVVRWGVGPADGFTGYISLDPGDGGVERWGDYSAAVADEEGDIWIATESINQSCTFAEFLADTTCGGTRSLFANWGSAIAEVTP